MIYLLAFPILKIFEMVGLIILMVFFPKTLKPQVLPEEHYMQPSPGRKYANYDKYDPTGMIMLKSEQDVYQFMQEREKTPA